MLVLAYRRPIFFHPGFDEKGLGKCHSIRPTSKIVLANCWDLHNYLLKMFPCFPNGFSALHFRSAFLGESFTSCHSGLFIVIQQADRDIPTRGTDPVHDLSSPNCKVRHIDISQELTMSSLILCFPAWRKWKRTNH